MKNEKGFSFTFDAIMGVMALTVAIVFISTNTLSFVPFPSQNITLKTIGDDILVSAIELDILETLNQSTIETYINSVIPNNYDYNLEINDYSYSGGFSLDQTHSYGAAIPSEETNYIETKRIFLIMENGDASNYCTAKIRLWLS